MMHQYTLSHTPLSLIPSFIGLMTKLRDTFKILRPKFSDNYFNHEIGISYHRQGNYKFSLLKYVGRLCVSPAILQL